MGDRDLTRGHSPPGGDDLLGLRITPADIQTAVARVIHWVTTRDPQFVCLANVHMTMTALDDRPYGALVNAAGLVLADGLPLVWTLRLRGNAAAAQVRGTDLLRSVCARAERDGLRVGFVGGTEAVLAALTRRLLSEHPNLQISIAISPPFCESGAAERRALLDAVKLSNTDVLFVGLGCPKQERWMYDASKHLSAVMIGVGAAFDFIAGTRREAPRAVREVGLEWLFRLASEPRRLWRRYLHHNPRFFCYALTETLALRRGRTA